MARRTPTPDSTSASRSPDASAGRANPLNLRQMRFVAAYLKTGNATAAAKLAGYAPKAAQEQGARLLSKAIVRAAIDKASAKAGTDAAYVLSTIRETVERCKQAEPVRDKDGEPTGEFRFDAASVLKGCELLGKYHKLFTDKVEHSGSLAVTVSTDVPESGPE